MSVSAPAPNNHAEPEAGRRRVVKPRGEQLGPEVRRTRGLPFAQVVTQWVCDPRYSTNLRTLYAILVTFADVRARDTSKGRPYRSVLAGMLGCTTRTLDRTIHEGEAAGLFRVEHRTMPKNPLANDANVYHLFDGDFLAGEWVDPLGPDEQAADVAEKRRQARGLPARGGRKKPPAESSIEGGVATPVSPGGSDTSVARGSDTGVARGSDTGVALDLEPVVESQSQETAAAVDLVPHQRTGEPVENPAAAADDAVVKQALELLDALPAEWRPDVAMAADVAPVIAERLRHGWTPDLIRHKLTENPGDLRKPVAALPRRAAALPLDPPRRAATAALRGLPECRECGRPLTGSVAADRLCRDCRPVDAVPDAGGPAATCFFCEHPDRPGWYRDPDDGAWIECDHADEFAAS